ncbi:WD40-repeat-containing domain protein [Crepidotus variabilis]|uniref:WD40-repeat-containing domain protein n=1 Tax=Crepidotus variabilis TaxID=179855 RepID=A0A9P6ETD2_9AGAR|nr:WD40-repeat-containing domain protein [Crepidotus variabilis]
MAASLHHRSSFLIARSAFPALPSASNTEYRRKACLALAYSKALDRVNVLGGNGDEGHTGCVNALAWARDGEFLISGGDDTTVRLWKLDTCHSTSEYPFTSRCVIHTGHTANIFSAQMLPHSWKIATAAGDNEVRVFDVRSALSTTTSFDREVSLSARQSCLRVIRCHSDRVKRVITEESQDAFLTVSEDGTVRQHDLRTPHNCSGSSPCADPLVDLGLELCTLSLSPLTPYQFVVAGDGPYAYLFDRRHSRRTLEARWGSIPGAGQDLTTCVRKFGRTNDAPPREPFRRDHVTAVRMASSNSHEVLVSFSGDAVYLFSTTDDPEIEESMSRKSSASDLHAKVNSLTAKTDINASKVTESHENVVSYDEEEDEEDDDEDAKEDTIQPDVPLVKPRMRFKGARNVATIKDVNFLGPNDEWVTSGSDDGNFFIWNKSSGALHGIYEGDSSVVNMVEGHPTLPLIAVSGIDYTVKLFAPARLPSRFSKMDDADSIIETNQIMRRTRVVSLGSLRAMLGDSAIQVAPGVDIENIRVGVPDCTNQ